MSHASGRRDACFSTFLIPWFHFGNSWSRTRHDGHWRWLWRLVRPILHSKESSMKP